MLRHSDDYATRGPKRPLHFPEDVLVLIDVLKDVEGSHDVELLRVRKLPRVDMEQLGARRSAGSHCETGRKEVAADQMELWKCTRHAAEHVAGSATQLQHRAGVREVLAHRPYDEAIAGAKPEALVFDRWEQVERLLVEAVARNGRARDERSDAVTKIGLKPARRAPPPVSGEPLAAREAYLHWRTATAAPIPVAP